MAEVKEWKPNTEQRFNVLMKIAITQASGADWWSIEQNYADAPYALVSVLQMELAEFGKKLAEYGAQATNVKKA